MNEQRRRTQAGTTLVELLVGLSLASIGSLAMVSFLTSAMRSSSAEVRASKASMELRNAINILASEARMSSSVSPYLVGDNAVVVTCTGSVAVTSTTVRFLVTEDDPAAPSGMTSYLVGYRYDPSTRRLIRGEIPRSSFTSCALPAGDPTDGTNGRTIAENVVAVDGDNNGSVDPVFVLSGNRLTVNLGVRVAVDNDRVVLQSQDTRVYFRTNLS